MQPKIKMNVKIVTKVPSLTVSFLGGMGVILGCLDSFD